MIVDLAPKRQLSTNVICNFNTATHEMMQRLLTDGNLDIVYMCRKRMDVKRNFSNKLE